MNSREFVEDYCDACKYIKFSTSSREYLEERIEQHVAEARAEQRHMCAKDSRIALFDLSPDAKPITAAYVVEQACLNATGEE